MQEKNNNNKLLPLRNFVKQGPYSSFYLSNLVQRKKLKAKKIGRNYFTTQKWFDEYLLQHGRKPMEKNSSQQGIETYKKNGNEQINLDELSNKIAGKILKLTVESKKNIEPGKEEKKKKKRGYIFLFFKKIFPKNLKSGVVTISVLLLLFSVLFANFMPLSSYHLSNLMESIYLFPQARLSTVIIKHVYGTTVSLVPIKEKEFKNQKEKGRVAGVSEVNYNLFLISEDELIRQASEAIKYFKNNFKLASQSSKENYEKVFLKISNYVYPELHENIEVEKYGVEEKLKSQGAVIVPYRDDDDAQEIKQKIEQMFSDRVIIEPDESERSGIVKPVFGSEVSDQKYLYMMVPVTEE